MSTSTTTSTGRTAPRPRAQGQWALGYREPLNPNERSKRDDDGLNVEARIRNIYSKQGFDSIDPGDLRGRFKWCGLYTQRAQGIPGGKTALLEPEELDAKHFMMRIRIDGGQMTAEQLDTIAGIATEFGRDVADVTDRQNIQLHWIDITDVTEIWDRLEAVGLSSTEACGDCPRVILGCPVAGVLESEVIDARQALDEVVDRYLGDPEFSNLPRKFKTSISGCAEHCTNHEINDVAFVGVLGPDSEPGFDVWVGGGLSTNPKFSQRLGVFVTSDEVAEVWAGVTSIFRDYGYRRSRNHARLKFLMADWGPEKFRTVLEQEYLHRELPDGPAPAPSPAPERDHVGIHTQVDGNVAIGFAPSVGRVSGTKLAEVARLARSYGDGRIGNTAQQKMILLGVAPSDVDTVVEELDALGFSVRPSVFRRGTMACTGLEFCKLAIVETKQRAEWIYQELEHRLPDFNAPLTINVNGCPNSCARFQTADIGFKGSMVPDGNGNQVEGFQIHLGGQLGEQAKLGHKFRGLKVTAEQAVDYCERILREYDKRREAGESFAAYVERADQAWLQ